VRTERKPSPRGESLLYWGPIEETSTGVESQGEFADDIPTGLWRFWYPDGKPRAEGSFNEGQLSGPWKFWLPDGQPDTQLSRLYRSGELAKDSGR
jgi:antitoxin component YwqK of YwqJK toxin-antitoxin module